MKTRSECEPETTCEQGSLPCASRLPRALRAGGPARRLVAFAAAAVVAIGAAACCSVGAWAFEDGDAISGIAVGGVTYDLNPDGKTAAVSGYCTDGSFPADGKVEIPSSVVYEGTEYSVTSLGDYCFHDCDFLAGIDLPDSVVSLGGSCFENCRSLTSITIPAGVASLGGRCFSGSSVAEVVFEGDAITECGDEALYPGNDSIKYIFEKSIPAALANTDDEDWSYYENFYYRVKFVDGAGKVLKNDDLKKGAIQATPPDVKCNSRGYAFSGWDKETFPLYLNAGTTITARYDSSNTVGVEVDGILYALDDGAGTASAQYYTGNLPKDARIAAKVSSAGKEYAVTGMQERLFDGCTTLEHLTISSSVEIEGAPLRNCSSLKTVKFENSPTSLDDSFFAGCSSLEDVDLPVSVVSIGSFAFNGCTNLKKVTSLGSITEIPEAAFTALVSLESVQIPGTVARLGAKCFYGCTSLAGVAIPDSVTSMGNYCFSSCTSLSGATLPSNITSLPYNCFYGCSSLAGITIPNGVTELDSYCFSGCTSLAGITLPNSVTSLGSCCFENCSSLAGVDIPDSVTRVGFRCFGYCTSLTSVSIPNGVTSSLDHAFEGCTSLASVAIPNGITELEGTFCSCTSLVNVTIPDSVVSLTDQCFQSCTSLVGITIPNSVTELGLDCFSGCTSLTGITIPDSVTELGWGCFLYCTALANVTIPDSVTSLGNSCFEGCTSLAGATIPDSISSLGESCFADCTSLADITIPDSVTSLGYRCFYGCTSLADVAIPDSLTSIGSRCFESCTSLAGITIPNSVTSLGERCFAECALLAEVLFEGDAVAECDFMFANGKSNGKYVFEKTIPAAVANAYGVTRENCYYRVKFVDDTGAVLQQNDVVKKDCPYTGLAAPANVPASSVTGLAFAGWSSEGYKNVTNSGMTIAACYGTAPAGAGAAAWTRLSGNTAIGTMKAIVNAGWSSSEWAIVATTGGYYDALSASGLAGLLDCPILMTAQNKLSDATATLIKNKKVKNVIVVGGTSAVSANVFNQIKALGVGVDRVAGNTAIGTANAIYEHGKKLYASGKIESGWSGDAVVATAGGYQDALSIAPYAYAKKAPIFLAKGNSKTAATLTDSTLSKVRAGGFTRTIITGGTAAVASSVDKQVVKPTRLAGNTAYGTCRQIADFCLANGMTAQHVGVATGQGYYDALAGAALCGKMNSVLILADDGRLSNIDKVVKPNKSALQEQGCYIFGGTGAVSANVEKAIKNASK